LCCKCIFSAVNNISAKLEVLCVGVKHVSCLFESFNFKQAESSSSLSREGDRTVGYVSGKRVPYLDSSRNCARIKRTLTKTQLYV